MTYEARDHGRWAQLPFRLLWRCWWVLGSEDGRTRQEETRDDSLREAMGDQSAITTMLQLGEFVNNTVLVIDFFTGSQS